MSPSLSSHRIAAISACFVIFFSSSIIFDYHKALGGHNFFYICCASIIFLYLTCGSNRTLVPLLLFSLPYTFYLAPYYFLDIPYHYLTETQSLELTNKSLALQHIFYHIFFNVGRKIDLGRISSVRVLNVSTRFFFSLIIFLLIMLFINIIAAPPQLGKSYDGLNESTVWIEYSYVFLIILVCSRPSYKHHKLTLIILLIYSVYPLLYSRRLQFIMVMLLIYYTYVANRFSLRTIYALGISAFIFLRIFESTRMGVSPTISSLLITTNSEGIMGSNQGGVMVSSTVYLTLVENYIFDLSFRIKSFFGNLFTGILPSDFNFSETYINLRALENLALPGNGGFTAVYFYLWLGLFGVFFLSYIVAKISFPKSLGFFSTPLMLGVLMTYPRLHSYNLLLTIKVLTLTFILLLALKYLAIKRKRTEIS